LCGAAEGKLTFYNSLVSPYALLIAMAIALAAGISVFGGLGGPKYRARELLTPNELEFFRRLRRALPDAYIFPQVALSAIIGPTSRGKRNLHDFRRIAQKRVDYAIYTANMEIVAIIELDDRTHDRARDAQRDAFVSSAGIRTLRFQSRQKPTVEQLKAAVFPVTTAPN
jgi:hypothetical protein